MPSSREDGRKKGGAVLLAGTLEKRSRWKKEWNYRFCVVRGGGIIAFYRNAPTVLDEDDAQEPCRGTAQFAAGDAVATEDTGRPFCISVGGELLSCSSRGEQQRWLGVINGPGAEAGGTSPGGGGGGGTAPPTSSSRSMASSLHWLAAAEAGAGPPAEEPALLLVPPEEAPREVEWRQVMEVLLASRHSAPSVLFLDGSEAKGGPNCAAALCQMSLYDATIGDVSFPVLSAGSGSRSKLRLDVRVLCSEPAGTTVGGAEAPKEAGSGMALRACAALALALALLAAGRGMACGVLIVVAMVLILLEGKGQTPSRKQMGTSPSRRRVTFMLERLAEAGSAETAAPPPPTTTTQVPVASVVATSCVAVPLPRSQSQGFGEGPRWVGCWTLDKARSELYDPILADLGVNYLLRRAADDAKVSALTVSVSTTHVMVNLKSWGVVEDRLPLDGSWQAKEVPAGSRMCGECRARVLRKSATELELLTEFPEGRGELRDTLTVSSDGWSLSHRIARSETLAITRYFSREPDR